jgi:hypothetical protein
MKKNQYKIVGAILILAALGYAYHKNAQSKKVASNVPVANEVKKTIPTEFEIVVDKALQTTNKFWTDGKTFFKQTFGPMIKSKPVVITEAEYVKEFAA